MRGAISCQKTNARLVFLNRSYKIENNFNWNPPVRYHNNVTGPKRKVAERALGGVREIGNSGGLLFAAHSNRLGKPT
jgi:hypothetical protein